MKADLHLHTTFSGDSIIPVDEAFEKAASIGLAALAITDHDMVDAIPPARIAAEKSGVCLVPGAEISCSFFGRMMHLLIYSDKIDQCSGIIDFLDGELFATKRRAVEPIIDALADAGLSVSIEKYDEEVARNGKGGSPLERLLEHEGIIRDGRDYASKIAPLIPEELQNNDWAPPLEQAIYVAHKEGAVAILAHPCAGGVYGCITDKELDCTRAMGINGLEVFHHYHSEKISRFLYDYARKNGLMITAGSDSHGHGTTNIGQPHLDLSDRPLPSVIHLRDLLSDSTC